MSAVGWSNASRRRAGLPPRASGRDCEFCGVPGCTECGDMGEDDRGASWADEPDDQGEEGHGV